MEDTKVELANTPAPIKSSVCRNCDKELTGAYCSHCGQKESKRDIRFFDLLGEYVGDIFVWESGLWKTLVSLLFRPGFVTREYFEGRRARYLPPLRLYLVISFLMFLLVSLTSSDNTIVISGEQDTLLNQQESDSPQTIDAQDNNLAAEFDFWEPGEKPQWATDLEQRLQTNIKSVEENPSLFLENFIDRLPYLMFLLLPFFAVLIQLAYLLSPFHYLQHLVFSLHYHSALFLLFSFAIVLDAMIDYQFGILILLWCAIYLPLALSKAYGSSASAAIGKSLIIGVGETMMLVMTLSTLAIVSVVTL